MSRSFKPTSQNNKYKGIIRDNPSDDTTWLDKLRGSNQWKKVRKLVANLQPLCPCGRPGKSVHHVRMAVMYPKLFFDVSNLVNLCDDCHGEVSKLEREGNLDQAIEKYESLAEANAQAFYDSI